jgi:uracil-DNA glycosylase family protein
MIDAKKHDGAAAFIPPGATLPQLRDAVQSCKGCDLYRHATQAIWGEGRPHPEIVMVGEQPGDKEDFAGHPFVGPAGILLNQAMEDAGIHRSEVYITNAVKHFKFEQRGKRRIHMKPAASEVAACYPWLEAELTLLRPAVLVCLGATAAQAVIGKTHRVLKERGKFFTHPMARKVTATVHPSSILRSLTAEDRHAAYEAFVQDLKSVRRQVIRTKSHAQ